jgi:hypothetical protein
MDKLARLPLSKEQREIVEKRWLEKKRPKKRWITSFLAYLFSPCLIGVLIANHFTTAVLPFVNIAVLMIWVFAMLVPVVFGIVLSVVLDLAVRDDRKGKEELLDRNFINFLVTKSFKTYYQRFLAVFMIVALASLGYMVTALALTASWMCGLIMSSFIKDIIKRNLATLAE